LLNNLIELYRHSSVKSLIHGFSWTFLGAVSSRALMLVGSIFVSRYLGPEEYGEFAIIQTTVNMVTELLGLAAGLSAAKYIAQYKKNDPQKASLYLSINILIAGCTGVLGWFVISYFAGPIASQVLDNDQLVPLLMIGAYSLFFASLVGGFTGAMNGLEAFSTTAKVSITVGFVSLISQVVAVINFGLIGVVYAILIVRAINAFLLFLNLKVKMKDSKMIFHFKGWQENIVNVLNFNIPALISSILVVPVTWLGSVMLVNFSDYKELGIFNAANQWRIALLFIPSTIAAVALPMLSKFHGEKSKDFHKILAFNIVINSFVAVIMTFGVYFFAPLIMSFYGEAYSEGFVVLQIIIISAGLAAINNVVGQAIMSMGKMWHGCGFNCIWGITYLAFAYQLIQSDGARGLAISSLIAFALHTILQSLYLFNLLKSFDSGVKNDE